MYAMLTLNVFLPAESDGSETAIRRYSTKKVFLRISQNQPVPELFFYKVTGLGPVTLLKKRLQHDCFLFNFAMFLRTTFFTKQIK